MQNKTIPIVIVLIILFLGGYFLLSKPKEAIAPPTRENTPIRNIAQEPAPAPVNAPKEYEIIYTGEGFSPAVTSIAVGDTVMFINKSDESFFPASNPHPEHTDYPEFDAKTEIAPGQSYKFTFAKPGEWGYHDHMNSKMFGVVVVK
jgi:plastocyanin